MHFYLKAAELAAVGFHVVPAYSDGTTAIAQWRNNASADLSLLSLWDRQFPNADVDIVLGEASNVLVVSVTDPQGFATLKRFAAAGREVPECPISTIIDGASGLWFRHVSGLAGRADVFNSDETHGERLIAPGLAVWGEGERIAAPVGLRKTWRPSTWIVPPWQVPPPVMPEWLVASIIERCGHPRPAKVDPQSPKAANANRRGWFYE